MIWQCQVCNSMGFYWSEAERLRPIHDLLMEHYRSEGYDVEEYQNHGMKITW